MGARLNTVFHTNDPSNPEAVVYGHWAGDNPTDATETLNSFFQAVETQTTDHRYDDPAYLAAKYVVYLSLTGRQSDAPLDFLGVGVVRNANDAGPECIAYVNCGSMRSGRPVVTFL